MNYYSTFLVTCIKRYVNFLYNLLIRPHSQLHDSYRREFILNILLLGSILLVLWGECNIVIGGSLQGDTYSGIPMVAFSIIVLLFIALLILSRKGYSVIASYLFIGLYFAITIYGSYTWGPDLQPLLISYILIIFITGILISGTASFIVLLIVSACILGFAQLQIQGTITPSLSWKTSIIEIRDMVLFVFMFFIITAVSWLSNFEHERANKRARASEEALKEERDLLEIKVEQRTEQLRIAQAEKVSQLSHFAEFGRLSSGLFHDLAGPLSNMSLNIEQLGLTLHPELPEIKKHLDLSIAASKRLERLIVSIKRQIQLNDFKEYFSLNEIIEDVIMLLNYKALKAKVTIAFSAQEKISIYQNPLKFHQIVSNLLSNAIDACQNSTALKKDVRIKLSRKKSIITLIVQDSGSGIDTAIINKIFDPFFTTKQQNNIGLGLATTKENVEHYFNGTISVTSVLNKGSTFTITFDQVKATTKT